MLFGNPWMVMIGAAAIGVPIVIHLLMQQKPKHMLFPAMRFLKEKRETNQRRLKLRHFLLLLLRCLVLLILALALAKPAVASALFGAWLTLGGIGLSMLLVAIILLAIIVYLRPIPKVVTAILAAILLLQLAGGGYLLAQTMSKGQQVTIGNREAPVAAVLIIDTSPRMELLYENQTRLQAATKISDWLLAELPSDSRVGVLETGDEAAFFSVDVSAARKRIETFAIRYDSHPITDALEAALDLLEDEELPQKEIYLLSDLTQRSWLTGTQDRIRERLEARPDIAIYVIDVGVESPSNFALSDLRLQSESITAAGTLRLNGELLRDGEGGSSLVQMYVEKLDPRLPVTIDGKTEVPSEHIVRPQTLNYDRDGSASFQFELSGLPIGVHHGWVQVDSEDSLSFDDRRFFTVEVAGQWNALVVTGEEVSPVNITELLSPYSFRQSGQARFQCTVVPQVDMSRERLEKYDILLLVDPNPISDAGWNLIYEYAERGGGVMILLGHNAEQDGAAAPSFNDDMAQRVLPGLLAEIWRGRDGDLFVNPDDFSHEIMAPFRQSRSTVPWSQFPVHRHWGLRAAADSSEGAIRVVARYSNRMPFLVEKQVGDGRVITMTTPYSDPLQLTNRRRWNDFSNPECWPIWLLVKQASEYLVQARQLRLNYEIGEIATLPNDSDRWPDEYRIYTPDLEDEPRTVQAADEELRYRFTNLPGTYRLKGNRDGVVLRGFSVNVPLADSNLARIAVEDLDTVLGKDRYQLADSIDGIQREQGVTRRGQEFYPPLIMLLVLCLALEHIMANRFYSQRKQREGSIVSAGRTVRA